MMVQHPTPTPPLRARMIADMSARNLAPASQTGHLRACKRFAAWLERSRETATPDDVKHFQQHPVDSGTRDQTMTGRSFSFARLIRRLFLEGLMALHRDGVLAFFGDHEGLAATAAFTK